MKQTFITAGLALSLPIDMAAGPVLGYFAGVFLRDRFGMPHFIVYIFLAAGFGAGVLNTVMIVRMMMKINNKS